jgi:hypothetical protein
MGAETRKAEGISALSGSREGLKTGPSEANLFVRGATDRVVESGKPIGWSDTRAVLEFLCQNSFAAFELHRIQPKKRLVAANDA